MSFYFPIIIRNTNSNAKYILLKGKNKLKGEKWPRLSIASHYIGKRQNKFGMFTNQYALSTKQHMDIDPNFFTMFTNKRLNALVNFTPEDLDTFKEIPIKDAKKASTDKFLQTMLHHGIPSSVKVSSQCSGFLNYIKERQTLIVPLNKSKSTESYSKTLNSMRFSDSELSNKMYNENDKSVEDGLSGSNRHKLLTPMKQLNNSSYQLKEKRLMFKNFSLNNLIPSEIISNSTLLPSQRTKKKRKMKNISVNITTRRHKLKF